MKLGNIRGFNTICQYVTWKLDDFSHKDKTFGNLFDYMFSELDNVMSEITDGYLIKKTTYGECKDSIITKAHKLKNILRKLPDKSLVGLSMDNSIEWIEMFWAILMCGYNPVLINLRLPEVEINKLIKQYDVKAVISDSREYKVKTIKVTDIYTSNTSEIGHLDNWGDSVAFMSSGTSENIKLCYYTAENFYYQLCNSVDIIKNCPEISQHYKGELKQLALLPFYHIFGFVAVYLWFGFFSRTFVFLKDLNPTTIQNTIKKHKVTHLFAVPMVWNAVYKATMNTISQKGEKTYNKFIQGLDLANSSWLGKKLTYKAMGEVRENLFGDSIKFLISGGGAISEKVLKFFNGIGYHLANGYGMTEIGIVCVELSNKNKIRNTATIGKPFKYTQFQLGEDKHLLVRGRNIADRICENGVEHKTDYDKWFDTYDLAENTGNQYYLLGRLNDVIISSTGENINPDIIEKNLNIPKANEISLINADGEVTLIVSTSNCYNTDRYDKLISQVREELARLNVLSEIKKIFITTTKLLEKDEIKISRKKLIRRYLQGELKELTFDTTKEDNEMSNMIIDCLKDIFATTLNIAKSKIALSSHFFTELGGTSLDYFLLSDEIKNKYNIDIKSINGNSLYTVAEIYDYLKNN